MLRKYVELFCRTRDMVDRGRCGRAWCQHVVTARTEASASAALADHVAFVQSSAPTSGDR